MRLRDPLADCQAEPEAPALRHPGAHAVRSPEALEDMRKICRRNPDPRVPHRERHVVWMTAESELDFPAGRSVLDGIGDEIQEELTQPGTVCHHRHVGRERQIHRYTLSFA